MTKITKNITSTLKFIVKAHEGQQYGIYPYWLHSAHVAEIGAEIFVDNFGEDEYIAALLHDVIEDTEYDRDSLSKMGYSDNVLDMVQLVTKDKTLDYDQNIQRIINSGNIGAMMVKFADNLVNFTGDKSHWETKRAEKAQKKYMKSMNDLGKVLNLNVDDILKKYYLTKI